MTTAEYKTIFTSVRPSRVAMFVDESDPDWRDTAVRVIEFFTTLWGGKHNIVVPTDGKTIADCFWDILETFDPDYLFAYRKTLGDLKLSNPEKYAEIVERETKQFVDKNPGADRESIGKEIDRALERAGASNFGISPELEQLLKERLAPFWFQQHVVEPGGITAGSIGHFPLTTISKLIPYCKPFKHVARLDVSAPHIPPVWYAPITGIIHREFAKELEGSGVTEFSVKIAEKQVRELFDIVVKGRIDESRSQFIAELEGSGEAPLKDFSEQTPFGLSMTNVSSYRSAKYQDWLEPVVVVAGDTFADFCLYYALSRLRDKVAWVLPEWVTGFGDALARARAGGEKIKEEEMLVYHLVHVLTDVIHYGTAQNRILLLSRSLDRAHLEQMRDTLDEATLSSPGTFKSSCDVGEFTIELLRSPLVAYETDNLERDYTKQLLGNKLAGHFDTPKPKNFSTIHPSEHRWITEFNVREHAFPRHPALGASIVRESRLGTHGARSGRNGVAYFCPNIGYFAGWGDIDRVVIKPEIFVPDAFEIFTTLFREQKLTSRVSDKGFFAQESIRKFGSLGYLAEYFRNEPKRAVLNKFRDTSKPQEGVHDEGVLLAADGRRYLNFDAICKILNNEEQSGKLVDDLVQRAVFYRGFIFKCAYCRNADWFQVGYISEEFTCKRCGRRQVYVREHWRQPREPAWFYKLDEIIFQGMRNDMIVPVLALDYLRRKSESFLFTPELEVVEIGTHAQRSEIDICCIPDGVLTIGEAKTDNRLGANAAEEDQSIAKYRALAGKIAARQVVFATISPAWSDATATKIREAFEGMRIQVVLLAQQELLA